MTVLVFLEREIFIVITMSCCIRPRIIHSLGPDEAGQCNEHNKKALFCYVKLQTKNSFGGKTMQIFHFGALVPCPLQVLACY